MQKKSSNVGFLGGTDLQEQLTSVRVFKTPCVYEYAWSCAENSLMFLCLSVFHPSIASFPSEPYYCCGFFVCVFFFHHSYCCFLPLNLSWLCCLRFSSPQLFFFIPLLFHILSLSLRPVFLPTVIFIFQPLCFFHCCSKIRQALFYVRGAARYHYPSDCHLDVLEMLGLYFS